MNIINYLSNLAIPLTILIIIIFGVKEKIKVFDEFIIGAKEGVKMTIKIFPTLIGLFVAIGVLRESNLINFIINIINPVMKILKIPKEIMPLVILRPISR